jgi:hypothetical protein
MKIMTENDILKSFKKAMYWIMLYKEIFVSNFLCCLHY